MRRGAAAGICAALLGATGVAGQTAIDAFDAEGIADTTSELTDRQLGFTAGSFFVAPIPVSNPTIGSGFLGVAGYLFSMDEGSDTSFLGLAGFRTDNGSEGFGLAGSLKFADGTWEVTLAAAEASVNYDLILGPLEVPLEQEGAAYFTRLGYSFSDRITLGGELTYLESTIRPAFLPDGFPVGDLDLDLWQTGLFATYDTTDDDLFPREGTWLNGTFSLGEVPDNDRDFTTAVALWNQYFPIGETDTVATRVTLCASDEATPFFMQCSIGRTDAFRGFTSFQFRGDVLASFQAEYRGRIGARFGYSVFAGAGSVAEDFSDLGREDWRGAAGVGLRYRVTRDYPLDLALDVTRNSEDEDNLYLYIGQAF